MWKRRAPCTHAHLGVREGHGDWLGDVSGRQDRGDLSVIGVRCFLGVLLQGKVCHVIRTPPGLAAGSGGMAEAQPSGKDGEPSPCCCFQWRGPLYRTARGSVVGVVCCPCNECVYSV